MLSNPGRLGSLPVLVYRVHACHVVGIRASRRRRTRSSPREESTTNTTWTLGWESSSSSIGIVRVDPNAGVLHHRAGCCRSRCAHPWGPYGEIHVEGDLGRDRHAGGNRITFTWITRMTASAATAAATGWLLATRANGIQSGRRCRERLLTLSSGSVSAMVVGEAPTPVIGAVACLYPGRFRCPRSRPSAGSTSAQGSSDMGTVHSRRRTQRVFGRRGRCFDLRRDGAPYTRTPFLSSPAIRACAGYICHRHSLELPRLF